MKTVWQWSLATETNRILQIAKNIGSGFYQSNHFPVLPWDSQTKYLSSGIYLPQLSYHIFPRFWHKASRYNLYSLPIIDDYHFTQGLELQLAKLELPNPSPLSLQQTWDQHGLKIINLIYTLLPTFANSIRSLHIYPTYFGSSVSFNNPTVWPADIHLYLRIDQDLYTLVEGIIAALTRAQIEKSFSATWSETEIVVDWMLLYSPLTQLLESLCPHSKFRGTLNTTREKIPQKIFIQSRQFLTQIGAPTFDRPFAISKDTITFNQSPINHLTTREQAILSLLITHAPDLVTYDDIANVIFQEDNDYSLYTISKVVERLRQKLDRQGISSAYLTTSRSRGYYLKN